MLRFQSLPLGAVLAWAASLTAQSANEAATPTAALLARVDAERLRAWHDLTAAAPHVAGSPGDARQIDALAAAFREMGLEVEVQDVFAWLAEPVAASLQIVEADGGATDLPLREAPVPGDRGSGDRGSGDQRPVP
ncbi:MAG: hypothetical protein IPM29_08960 [Planctomycetes bacterium]|nr:hypothetical protein [Planctomycetota bacterium]